METDTSAKEAAQNAARGYISLPPEPDPEPTSWFSPGFIILAVLLIGAAAVGGAIESGKLNLNKYFNAPKAAAQAAVPAAAHAPAVPAVALKPGAFVVTAISLGQPSYAIINGISRTIGDAVTAPGVTGWTVRRIDDGLVWFQNGQSVASVPLTLPGIKPLDDQLHPLN